MILYSAGDLIWATKIKGTGESVDVPCRPVRSVEMLEERLADSDVRALIVDLEAPEVGLAMIRRLRSDNGPGTGDASGADAGPARIRIVAFGPHVNKDLLQQARDAGADEVLPRGAFDANLAEILINLDGRAAGA